MANTIVRKREKYTFDHKYQEYVIKVLIEEFKLPVPRWILTNERRVVLVVDKNLQGLYIGKNGITVARIERRLGKRVIVVGANEDEDALSLIP